MKLTLEPSPLLALGAASLDGVVFFLEAERDPALLVAAAVDMNMIL